jgi:hypothetical protein
MRTKDLLLDKFILLGISIRRFELKRLFSEENNVITDSEMAKHISTSFMLNDIQAPRKVAILVLVDLWRINFMWQISFRALVGRHSSLKDMYMELTNMKDIRTPINTAWRERGIKVLTKFCSPLPIYPSL